MVIGPGQAPREALAVALRSGTCGGGAVGYFVFQSASGGLFFVERHRGMSAFARLKTRMRGHRCPLVAGAVFVVLLSLGLAGRAQAQFSPPAVTNVNPNSGPTAGGTNVTITGLNFFVVTAVNFGGPRPAPLAPAAQPKSPRARRLELLAPLT